MDYLYDAATGKKSAEKIYAWAGGAWVETKNQLYTYDINERLQSTIFPTGGVVEYDYDVMGNLASVKDENNTTPNTFYEYDDGSRLSIVRQKLGAGWVTTTYGYDHDGNLVSVTDPNGNVTTYAYDDFGQMLSQTSPVTGTTSYTYDLAGNLLSTTDARGVTTGRTYDALGRVTSSTSTAGSQSEIVTWAYDSATFGIGRVSTMTDPTGSTIYDYTRLGQLASEEKTIGTETFFTRYGYDGDGNRNRITYPSGRVVDYEYDWAGRPTAASSPDGSIFVAAAEYEAFGPLTRLTYGNGTRRLALHDTRSRPLSIRLDSTTGTTLQEWAYEYDPVGNILGIRDIADPRYDRSFAYDDLNRLVTANSGSALWGTGSYEYDAMGNMLAAAVGGETRSFTYQGTTPKLSAMTHDGSSRTVTYDAAGNESTVGGYSYDYTRRNSLGAGDGLSYAYDGRGIRTTTSITGLGALYGVITNAIDATPLGGAVIRITGTATFATSAADGSFELVARSGPTELLVTLDGYVASTVTASIPEGATAHAGAIALSPIPGVVSGTVVNETSEPIAGATVIVTGMISGVTTGTDGTYTIEVPPGTHTITVSKERWQTADSASFTILSAQSLTLDPIVLSPAPALIHGSVVSSSGTPLQGSTVLVTGTTNQTFADAQGSFVLEQAAGTWTLTVSADGYEILTTDGFTVAAGDEYDAGAIALTSLVAKIRGVVVDSVSSSPLAGAGVALSGTAIAQTTDDTGAFDLTAVKT
jgi:YD repeat-containing protein